MNLHPGLSAIDPRQARRHFERAAHTYAEFARLEAEIATRMLERLDYVKLAPARILDAGAGLARESDSLLRRYPGASLVALDFSLKMLRAAQAHAGVLRAFFGGSRTSAVCAQLACMPFAAECFELIWSNMALHGAGEPLEAIREFSRVLRPGGLVMFSTVGPDTLRELRAAAPLRTHRFLDMHDIGDRLVGAGFSAPVMDMEVITLTYPTADALLHELRATGQTAALHDSGLGLGGRRLLSRIRETLPAASSGGRVSVTVEVVYGHAWKDAPQRAANGPVKIDISALRQKLR